MVFCHVICHSSTKFVSTPLTLKRPCDIFLWSIQHAGSEFVSIPGLALHWPGGFLLPPLETLALGTLLSEPSRHVMGSPSHMEMLQMTAPFELLADSQHRPPAIGVRHLGFLAQSMPQMTTVATA